MATQTTEYVEAFNNLQNELQSVFDDVSKKADPTGISKDLLDLQTKLITTTINNLATAVKVFRKSLE